MAKFAVLDQSLTCVGGHPYELALRILQVADRLGYEPVLATNKRFTDRTALPRHWRVLGVFADESWRSGIDHPLDIDGVPLDWPVAAYESWQRRWLEGRVPLLPPWWREQLRRRYIARFAAACAAIHAAVDLRQGDHVLLPTASLFGLLGLVRFLSRTPGLAEVTWHGLFHRGLLQGREPEYAAQAARERNIRRQFEYLAQHIAPGQLRLYGTTPKLARQFNRLSPLEFGVLPYPVDARAFQNDERAAAPRRLRLMCAGFLRREKGKALARRFVRGIWDEELVSGRMQLVVQTNRRQARRIVSRRAGVPLVFRSGLERADASPILWLRHPLSPPAYANLIRQSDIAVFLHDGRMYYTQCSGVLVEMLSGGVPVLVPAGSWLADQVSESVYEHLDEVRRAAPVVSICRPDAHMWHSPFVAEGGVSGPTFGSAAAATECDIHVPPAACAALVSFTWHPHTAPGTYVRVAVQQGGPDARSHTHATVAILGPRSVGKPVATLIPLDGQAGECTLHLCNAYDDARVSVGDVEARMLSAPASGAATYPAGRVGLVFADVDQLPALVRNVREHYAHYLESAREFSATWCEKHDTQRVVQRLLSGSRADRRSVA